MVRFIGDYRIKKHNPLPTPVTVYCLGFHPCEYTHLAEYFTFAFIYIFILVFIVYSINYSGI